MEAGSEVGGASEVRERQRGVSIETEHCHGTL